MPAPAIEIHNLTKSFVLPHEKRETLREWVGSGFRGVDKERFHALNEVSFEVPSGSCFGIIGRNGSGKSTLLKILAGIIPPTSGSVEVNGKISPFLELGVGFNPELTARDNVYLNATVLGLSTKEIDAVFDEIIAFAELERFVDQKLKNFSSGMQVRLAFSVAIKADAQVYLMDEVLAVGDMSFQQKCFDIFRQLKKAGKTIILVSHDLVSVRQMCNRALYLKNGRVDKIGDINEVVDHYTYDTGRVESEVPQTSTVRAKTKKKKRPSVEITSVHLVDKYGYKTSTFVSQDSVRIEVSYRRHDRGADRPLVGVAVYREDGVHVYGTNSRIEENEILLQDTGKVILEIPSLPLIQGDYQLSVGFRDQQGNIYDLKDREYTFHVQRQKPNDGLVDLHVGFSHEK